MAPAHTPRILVLDDDQLLRAFLIRVLTYAGYEVTAPAAGEAGLPEMTAERFDLVVADDSSELLPGWGIIGRVRRYLPDVPILHLDDLPDPIMRDELLLNVASLCKPFGVDQLRREVTRLLTRADLPRIAPQPG
jgi:DNA-binding response OmpR family regulator